MPTSGSYVIEMVFLTLVPTLSRLPLQEEAVMVFPKTHIVTTSCIIVRYKHVKRKHVMQLMQAFTSLFKIVLNL